VDLHAVPATVADRPAVVATIVAAFANDPTFRFFFPDEATFPEYAAAFAGYLFDRRVHKGTVWICADGAVAALWDEPDFSSASAPHASPEPAQTPRLDLPEAELARIRAYDAAVAAALPTYPHWYLGILATRPDHAGRGLGRRLMAHGVARAHAEEVPAVLETMNPSNVDLYVRAGWQVYGQTSAADVPRTWVLVNPPVLAQDPGVTSEAAESADAPAGDSAAGEGAYGTARAAA
jgi:Acetyltransferases